MIILLSIDRKQCVSLSISSRIQSYRQPVTCLWSDHQITDHRPWNNDPYHSARIKSTKFSSSSSTCGLIACSRSPHAPRDRSRRSAFWEVVVACSVWFAIKRFFWQYTVYLVSPNCAYYPSLCVLSNCCDNLHFGVVTMDWNNTIRIICKMAEAVTKKVRPLRSRLSVTAGDPTYYAATVSMGFN